MLYHVIFKSYTVVTLIQPTHSDDKVMIMCPAHQWKKTATHIHYNHNQPPSVLSMSLLNKCMAYMSINNMKGSFFFHTGSVTQVYRVWFKIPGHDIYQFACVKWYRQQHNGIQPFYRHEDFKHSRHKDNFNLWAVMFMCHFVLPLINPFKTMKVPDKPNYLTDCTHY